MMTYRKLLLILAAGALLLTLLLLKFIPWEALVTLLFLLGIMVSPVISQLLQIAKPRLTPIPHYQPPSEQPPRSPRTNRATRNNRPPAPRAGLLTAHGGTTSRSRIRPAPGISHRWRLPNKLLPQCSDGLS